MIKKLAICSVMVLLSSQPLMASDDADYSGEQRQQEWKGIGGGGLLGAIFGGPPGLILGAAGGALVGHANSLETGLETAREEIGDLKRQLQSSRSSRQQISQKFNKARDDRTRQLEAIVDGFALNVLFRTESSVLEPRYQRQLQKLARSLAMFPELGVHVDAYADRRGTNDFNMSLSAQRADVVARHLQAGGVSVSRIRKNSHGERAVEYPLGDTEGLGFDRRVLIYFCLEKGNEPLDSATE
ncbi:MAG: OmpA family protein [Sedimenticola sp.]